MFAAAIAIGAIGASAQGLPSLPFAVAGAGCTQEDIPAIEVILTAERWTGEGEGPFPYLRIEVAGTAPGVPSAIDISPLRRDPAKRVLARAELHRDRGEGIWLSGTLRFYQEGPGRKVKGDYAFCMEEGRCLAGAFNAIWRKGVARCG